MSIIDIQKISNNRTLAQGQVFIGIAGTDPVTAPVSVFSDSTFTASSSIATPIDLDFDGMPVQVTLENKQGVLDTIAFFSNVVDRHPGKVAAVRDLVPHFWSVIDRLYNKDAEILRAILALFDKLDLKKEELDKYEHIDHLFDNGLEFGAQVVAVNIETAEDAKATLGLIEREPQTNG